MKHLIQNIYKNSSNGTVRGKEMGMRLKLVTSVFLLFVGSAFGQAVPTPQGAIQGTVTDQSGEPLPGANVVLSGFIGTPKIGRLLTAGLTGRF